MKRKQPHLMTTQELLARDRKISAIAGVAVSGLTIFAVIGIIGLSAVPDEPHKPERTELMPGTWTYMKDGWLIYEYDESVEPLYSSCGYYPTRAWETKYCTLRATGEKVKLGGLGNG